MRSYPIRHSENSHMRPRLSIAGSMALATMFAACTSQRGRVRADSVQALVVQQAVLMEKLTAQRDSVTRILGDANSFVGKIDSSIGRVRGLPAASRASRGSEGPLEDQVRQRRDMLRRVDALVTRAR